HPDEDIVEPAVIVTLELNDLRASGIRARQAHGGLNDLGTGRSKSYALGARHGRADQLCQDLLRLMLATVQLSECEGFPDPLNHPRGSMPEDSGTHSQRVIQVATPIHAVQPGTEAARVEQRRGTAQSEIAADSAREIMDGLILKRSGQLELILTL